MIIGKIHPGSGLGDQLFTYITTRTIALDKGYDFGFVGKEFFKGKDFMNLDWGKEINLEYHILQPAGLLLFTGKDFRRDTFNLNEPYYNPEFNFIEDGTVIDATCAQDERYWGHRLNEIREWLKVELLDMPDDLCVINFRGGEYTLYPDLFLTEDYWTKAIMEVEQNFWVNHPKTKISLEVHTDDFVEARKMFQGMGLKIYQGIELNWRSVRYAKHLILSNSAFGILPALLNENVEEVIAPRYWARRNIKEWSMPSNYYKKFTYI